MINSAAAAELYIAKSYIYMGHGTVPKNVTRIIVHESVTAIPKDAFDCLDLKEVILPEGLIEIRYGAFSGCTSLVDINFPSTLRVIGGDAFCGCSSLVRVDFNEGLQTIGAGAFQDCRSILHLKIPSSVIAIEVSTFHDCYALKDVQLCEGLLRIGYNAFCACCSLLCIGIPSSVTTIDEDAFMHCNFLRNVAIAPDSTWGERPYPSCLLDNLDKVHCSIDSTKGRFDGLPLHRLCFHQIESATLLEEIKEHVTKENLFRVDCLGMTPLHIVACTGRHDVGVYKLLVGKFPRALLIEDKWGESPLAYAMLCKAPLDVIHFLFENHSKSLRGSLPFNFSTVFEKLAKKMGMSAEFMRNIIQAQRTYFPTLEIGWEQIVNKYVADWMHAKLFRVLVEASVSKRLNCMSLDHQLAIDNMIDEIDARRETRRRSREDGQRIIDSIQHYAHQYREFLKEAMTLIELALWKSAINELEKEQRSSEEGNHGTNGAEVVNSESRMQCRFKCNTEDIFPIILSFL